MKHAQSIMHRFSDEYVSTLVAGNDPRPILDSFLKVYPELEQHLHEDASILDSMYGDFRYAPSTRPDEVSAAYRRVSGALEHDPAPVFARSQSSASKANWRPAIFGSLRTLSKQTTSDGQQVVRFKWSPWKIGTFAIVTAALLVIFVTPGLKLGSREFRIFTSPFQSDASELAQPQNVAVISAEDGSKIISWEPVANATSYIVTVATANGDELIPTPVNSAVIDKEAAASATSVKIVAVTKDLTSQPTEVPHW